MKEKELQTNIIRLATFRGWHHYHTYDSRKSAFGWPDLVLCRPPHLLFIELKSEKGVLSPYQVNWLNLLGKCNQVAMVWRPKHWHDGTIERILK